MAAKPSAAPAIDQEKFNTTVKPFLTSSCYACHNNKRKMGAVNLEAFATAESVGKDPETWDKVVEKIQTGQMPPPGLPKPAPAVVKEVTSWIETEFARVDELAKPDPGRVTARRLNRTEYNNTVRDLLGVTFRPADSFPQDDSGYGFDNIGDVLSLSPVLMERYLAAAERISQMALFGPEATKPSLTRHQPPYRNIPPTPALMAYDRTGLSMLNALHATQRFPVDAEYVFRIVPEGFRPANAEPVHLALWLDGKQVADLVIDPPNGDLYGQPREHRMRVPAGEHWLAATVLNVYDGLPTEFDGPNPSHRPAPPPRNPRQFIQAPDNATPEQLAEVEKRVAAFIARQKAQEEQIEIARKSGKKRPASKVYIDYLEVMGPYAPRTAPAAASLAKIYVCGHTDGHHVASCRRKIVSNLVRRAYRRPVEVPEVNKLLQLIAMAEKDGESFEQGLGYAMQAILVSPDFLFRIEKDQRSAQGDDAGAPVGQHELASRLSYFLWSSMPDDRLLDLADRKQLRTPSVLAGEVRRMLKDPKAHSLVEEFGGQWLQIRGLESAVPDRTRFPEFEDYLRMSMRRETELFFEAIMREDRSIVDFLDGKFTFLNERLANFYNIPGVSGPEFRRVDLTGTQRSGVLTQASVLTVSSYANRTSPVLRGKWVLENILNAPPPPPPPGVPNLDDEKVGTTVSLRQQLEAHRKNAACASCHSRMDPLGFGLENFDAIGAWRTQDGKFEIDSSGSLPDGRSFQGPDALKQILTADRQVFAQCLTDKLLTYALGRGLERYDRRTVKAIARRLPDNDYRFSSLVLEIVNSLPFQMRKGDKPKS